MFFFAHAGNNKSIQIENHRSPKDSKKQGNGPGLENSIERIKSRQRSKNTGETRMANEGPKKGGGVNFNVSLSHDKKKRRRRQQRQWRGAGKWRKSVDDNTEVGLMIVKFSFRNSRCLKSDEDAQ